MVDKKRNYKFWTNKEIELLKNNFRSSNVELMSIFPDKTFESIKRAKSRYKLTQTHDWTDGEIDFLKENYFQISKADLVSGLGKHPQSIVKKINEFGLDSIDYKRDGYYSHNINSFESKEDLTVCYWAGFLVADGCNVNNKALKLSLSQKDIEHLYRFVKFINYDGQIVGNKKGNKIKKNGEYFRYCSVWVSNAKEMCSQLSKNFGFVPRKTHKLEFPLFDNLKQKLAFIAGYIDGDGYISLTKNKKYLFCGINGTEKFLDEIKNIFDELFLPKKGKRLANVSKEKGIYRYSIKGYRAYSLIKTINCMDLPLLKRKWDKINLLYL